MENVIIGTAGHIDHGKTTLIKALTNRDTDRLKEEKKRGISIELGFSYFDLPSNKRAGIIDVPGHEKFVKHMLAGVGGMDVVMLVVAADEGVMPQTIEHLDILSLLDVKKGVIVVTKKSMVDQEFLELVLEDIKEAVKGSFMEGSKLIAVDSINKDGIDDLIKEIDRLSTEVKKDKNTKPVRLPIDRVFTIKGFGTVITGTLLEGTVRVDDQLELLPQHQEVRVRNIQTYGEDSKTAYSGQRVAINLSNVKKDEIERGNVLAAKASMETTMMIDGKLSVLKNYKRILENRTRVRVYNDSNESIARLTLLDREEAKAEEELYVQIRLENEIAIKKGDKIVLRLYSPMETIGGVEVIDPYPQKHKRFDEVVLKELQLRESGDLGFMVETMVEKHSRNCVSLEFLSMSLSENKEVIQTILSNFVKEGRVISLGKLGYIHRSYYNQLKEKVEGYLDEFHKNFPLQPGMMKEELRSRIEKSESTTINDHFYHLLVEEGVLRIEDQYVALSGFEIKLTEEQKAIEELILAILNREPFNPPRRSEILKEVGETYSLEEADKVFNMLSTTQLMRLNEDVYFLKEFYDKAKEEVKSYLKKHESVTIAEFRDHIQTNRKIAMALLEKMDSEGITKRSGDQRFLK